MTQEEIIEMARQAGLMAFKYPDLISKSDWENLEAFAKLVAAKEREACAKLVEEPWMGHPKEIAKAIRARGEA